MRRRLHRWVRLVLGALVAVSVLLGGASPAEAGEEEGQAPWPRYDPGPPPRAADGEPYHGRGDSSESPWEEDGGCEHRYYSWGTPYWDCHARGMSGDNGVGDECEEEDFWFLTVEGGFVSVEGETRENGTAFVVCADMNGPYTADDFRLYVPPDDDEDGDAGETRQHPDVEHDGTHYRVCTYRQSGRRYGTNWMHCPTYGFRTVPCIETQGLGISIGGFQIGDENQGFWEGVANRFSDQFEARVVPDVVGPSGGSSAELGIQLEHARRLYGDDLSWWYEEIIAESDSEQGKGCTLAEIPPTYRTCEEINQDRDRAHAVLDNLDDRYSSDDVTTGVPLMQSLEQAYYEEQIRDLESQGSIIPDTCFGTFPTEAYRVLYDSGSAFDVTGWGGQLMASLGELAFGLLKLAVAAALWAVRSSMTLDVTQYRQMVADLADRWDVEILNFGGDQDLSVMDMAWFAVFVTAGFLALRGKASRGGGEIVGSIVMAAIGSLLMAGAFTSGGYFDSAVGLVDSTSRGMLLAGSGCDANDELSTSEVEQLVAGRYDCGDDTGHGGLGGVIHREFVERPFRYINWGTDDLSPGCQEAEERLLRLPGIHNDYATRFMEREGCIDEANHSGEMTIGRLMSVLVVTLLGLFISVILLSIAFTLLFSKFVIAILFGFLPFFVVAAIMPGKGRRPAIWAFETMVKTWVIAFVMGAILGSALVGFQEVAEATEGRPMIERQTVLGMLVIVLWLLYKQADKGGQIIASAGGRKAGEMLSPSAHWAGAAAGEGGGIQLNGPARWRGGTGISQAANIATAVGAMSTATMTAAGGIGRVATSPLRGTGKSIVTRNAERRTANRSIANLVRKDILAGNLPVGTPASTRGLKRRVKQARRQYGPNDVLPDPKGGNQGSIPPPPNYPPDPPNGDGGGGDRGGGPKGNLDPTDRTSNRGTEGASKGALNAAGRKYRRPATGEPGPDAYRKWRQDEFRQLRTDLDSRLEKGQPIPPQMLNNLGIFSPAATAWNNQVRPRTPEEARTRLADFPGDRLTKEQMGQAAERIRAHADANIAAAQAGHQEWLKRTGGPGRRPDARGEGGNRDGSPGDRAAGNPKGAAQTNAPTADPALVRRAQSRAAEIHGPDAQDDPQRRDAHDEAVRFFIDYPEHLRK